MEKDQLLSRVSSNRVIYSIFPEHFDQEYQSASGPLAGTRYTYNTTRIAVERLQRVRLVIQNRADGKKNKAGIPGWMKG
ncbi:hypothetical protein F2P79_000614 [Pimephales promelas]|nr:hypothetical protein F2P79_000614 [Pimephales promelas]